MNTSLKFPTRALVSQNDQAMIQRPDVPRSKFMGSWTRKTTFNAGRLVPFLVDEILPGDHMTYNVTAYVRMATPLFPLFDNQRIDTFFFFVPNRLVWENWTKFMGEQADPSSSIDYTVPITQIATASGAPDPMSLHDHFGLPTNGQLSVGGTYEPNALPFRAYYLIWNQWFRDQNIQSSVTIPIGDGPDVWDATAASVMYRTKAHDYFTSALPWPQKFTAPTISLGSTAPVLGLGAIDGSATAGPLSVREADDTSSSYLFYKQLWDPAAGNQVVMRMGPDSPDAYPDVYADLSQATGITINTLRQAWLVQALLERDARGGTRYVELIKSHFGVTNPDFRLQRPEYIGGGQTPLNITPIAQTAPTTGVPLGALGAAGNAAGQHRASYAATEHGYILGLINVRSELSYQQGIHKMWARRTRYDFYWPALAGLGEQAISNYEIYATGLSGDADVWGYQERWHEYRTRYSEVTGMFRSTTTGNIDEWHLAQQFTGLPTLGNSFIRDIPPMSRVLAAGSQADNVQYLANILIQRSAVRPIPMYGTPVALGRF